MLVGCSCRIPWRSTRVIKERYEQHHRSLSGISLALCGVAGGTNVPDRILPDKAIDLVTKRPPRSEAAGPARRPPSRSVRACRPFITKMNRPTPRSNTSSPLSCATASQAARQVREMEAAGRRAESGRQTRYIAEIVAMWTAFR